MGGGKPSAPAPVQQVAPAPIDQTKPPESDASFSAITDFGDPFNFSAVDYEQEQFPSNFFSGGDVPTGLERGSQLGNQAAYNTLLDTLTTGGTVDPNAQFTSGGFDYLRGQGQNFESTAAGGLSALHRLIKSG